MSVSKVVVNNQTILDITDTTATSDTVLDGEIFYSADGTRTTGTMQGGGSSDIPFDFGGMNATLVHSYSTQYTLADTSFVIGSSASTSATSIKATVSNAYTNTTGSPTVAYGDDDIVVVQKCRTAPTHSSTATNKALSIAGGFVMVSWFSKRKTTSTGSKTYRQVYTTSSSGIIKYYNTSGTVTRAASNYGFYMTPQVPTVYSTTATSTYVRCNSPILYYRASSSYESTTNIKLVTACTFDWTIEVYRVKTMSTPTAAINDAIDTLLEQQPSSSTISWTVDSNASDYGVVAKSNVPFDSGQTWATWITTSNATNNYPGDVGTWEASGNYIVVRDEDGEYVYVYNSSGGTKVLNTDSLIAGHSYYLNY